MKKSFEKYFIPNKENDHKPHFLREKSVIATTALAAILLFASVIGSYVIKNSKFLAAIQSAFLVDLANEDRAEEGASNLVINEKLVMAAQLKANDMAQKSYFAHISPEGVTPWHWFDEAGYTYIYAGENLAVNFNRSEDVQRAWMNSPLHRANILNNRYKEIGIATAEGMYKGDKTTFVVQMFGTPVSSSVLSNSNTQVSVSQEVEETQEANLVAVNITPEVEGDFDVNKQALEKTEQKADPKPEAPAFQNSGSQEKVALSNTETVPTESQTEIFTETSNPAFENQNVAGAEDLQPNEDGKYTSRFERFLVNPGDAVNKAYIILFVVILFALILKIFISIRKQHPKNIAYGVLLLILVLIFMYINQEMFVNPVIAAA